jgi:hypothetical protein
MCRPPTLAPTSSFRSACVSGPQVRLCLPLSVSLNMLCADGTGRNRAGAAGEAAAAAPEGHADQCPVCAPDGCR